METMDHNSVDTRAEIFTWIEVLRWSRNTNHCTNELFKQFFIAIFDHYFSYPEESPIRPTNLTEKEKSILETHFLDFASDVARNFTMFESSHRTRQIVSGIAYFRLEFIPTYLELFPTEKIVDIWTMMARVRMREYAWVEQVQGLDIDHDEIGPSGHFWWAKTFEIPENYSDPADEYLLED